MPLPMNGQKPLLMDLSQMINSALSATARSHCDGPAIPTVSVPANPSMLPMRLLIREDTMKRQWQIRRQFQKAVDATQRWDHAYQHLLQWSQPPPSTDAPIPSIALLSPLEVTHDQCP